MISVVLYGRNDSHGYNLHKRAAISLNCIAEVLTADGDELIFVDYNTPDDFPTFPEAIADTLTDRAKRLLRILRVRPQHHERFRERTELVALEAVARNVGVRRSNPANRWILSTNTDMIFVPRHGKSLSDIAAGLDDAYYHLPRFELPEPLWESLDRQKPDQVIGQVEEWGRVFQLNEISCLEHPETRYDAPGDFQLILRSDLFRIHGFHEQMLLALHLDSNIAKRLALLPRTRGELVDQIFGYHCDHLRQLTPAHSRHGQRNDNQVFFLDLTRPDVPEQAATWGLAGETIEEVAINATTKRYLEALRSTISTPMNTPTEFFYRSEGSPNDRYDYSVDHVLPFLEASVASYPSSTVIAWLGSERSLLSRFAASWGTMGFSEPILVSEGARWLGPELPANCKWASDRILEERGQVFVFDFGRAPGQNGVAVGETEARLDAVVDGFKSMAESEMRRVQSSRTQPRRFIGVNPIVADRVVQLFEGRIAVPLTPNSTHLKQGFVIQELRSVRDVGEMNCAHLLVLGTAAAYGPAPNRPESRAIFARPGVAGYVTYGPYIAFSPGAYEAVFEFSAEPYVSGRGIDIDVAGQRGKRILARQTVKPHTSLRHYQRALKDKSGPLTCILPFQVERSANATADDSLEFRIWSPGTIRFCLVDLKVRQIARDVQEGEPTAKR